VTYKKNNKELHPIIQFGNDLKFETSTPDIQKSIEESDYFKKGKIALHSMEESNKKDKIEDLIYNPMEFKEVTTIQDAIEILKKEPYLIDAKQLKTPAQVKKQAETCKVTFPNLKFE